DRADRCRLARADAALGGLLRVPRGAARDRLAERLDRHLGGVQAVRPGAADVCLRHAAVPVPRAPFDGAAARAGAGRLEAGLARHQVAGFAVRIGERREYLLVADAAELGQGPADAWKRQVLPRNVRPWQQRDLQAFHTGGDVAVLEGRAVDDLDLADAGDRIDRKQSIDANEGVGLLARLAPRGVLGALVQLHVAGRQGPVSLARIDGAAAQQNAIFAGYDGTNDDLGIFIVDETTGFAYGASARVAVRNLAHESG